jgi:type I restriction enzyme S subunit
MKPSGLGWAGDIPAEWDVAKTCLLAKLESGHTPSRQHPEYWVPEECTIPWFSLADVWQLREGTQEFLGETTECISPTGLAHSAARLLPAGTVVLSRTASVGFAGIMPRPMATTQDFANWVPGERVLSVYLLYALRAMRDEFSRVMTGSTHQTIYMPDIRRLAIPVPPRNEQMRIVAQLRARLPKVDKLIAKQEQLLVLLAEKRQALITQAVTKGLESNAPMKDSGVESIGPIPADWSSLPIRRLITGMEQGWSPIADDRLADEGEWAVLKLGSVFRGRFRPEQQKALSVGTDPEHRYEVRSGDLLITRANTLSLVGDACVVDETPARLMIPDLIYRLAPRRDLVDPTFLALFLLCDSGRAQIESDARGSSMSMAKVSGSHVRSWLVSVPPTIDEQRRIVAHVRRELRRLDGLAERAQSMVDKLREYRQALITAAVTGKLDVSKEAA